MKLFNSINEINEHLGQNTVWLIIDNQVLDLTKFIEQHPGGSEVLIKYMRKDVTKLFHEIHSINAKQMINNYKIGEIKMDYLQPNLENN